jgi:hypothetical protein
VGFCASPPLAALGGAFFSSAISVDACGKAPFHGLQKHKFCHIADKYVNHDNFRAKFFFAPLAFFASLHETLVCGFAVPHKFFFASFACFVRQPTDETLVCGFAVPHKSFFASFACFVRQPTDETVVCAFPAFARKCLP